VLHGCVSHGEQILVKKFLVTGGAGFIGSHLADALLSKGYEVLCLDNFFTGSKDNIKHLFDNPCFQFIKHDVNSPYYCDVDGIFHLACPASPVHYQRDPVQTLKTSVLGSVNILGLAKRLGVPVLFSSTSEVYGDPLEHPQSEPYWGNVNPIGMRACYDEGKRCAETLFFDYHRQYSVPIKVIRIFNTYGTRMATDDGRVVSNFIVQALRNESITLYGDGSQTRSFSYVSDLVSGIQKMFFDSGDFTGPVNIGNPHEFTMLELAEKVIALSGSDSKIIHMDLPEDDPKKRKPDISLAQEKLGWKPTVTLDEGLRLTIDYFKEKIKLPESLV
jgi:UDP-glucuronate decarboxylase